MIVASHSTTFAITSQESEPSVVSIEAIKQVYAHSCAPPVDRSVLVAIAEEARSDGTNAHPSIRLLADKTGWDKDTVSRAINRLEALGELAIARPAKPGRGRFNYYRVLVGDLGDQKQDSNLDEKTGSGLPGSVRSTGQSPPDGDQRGVAWGPKPTPMGTKVEKECPSLVGTLKEAETLSEAPNKSPLLVGTKTESHHDFGHTQVVTKADAEMAHLGCAQRDLVSRENLPPANHLDGLKAIRSMKRTGSPTPRIRN